MLSISNTKLKVSLKKFIKKNIKINAPSLLSFSYALMTLNAYSTVLIFKLKMSLYSIYIYSVYMILTFISSFTSVIIDGFMKYPVSPTRYPPVITFPPCFFPSSTYPSTLSSYPLLIKGPICVPSSVPLPNFNPSAYFLMPSVTSLAIGSSTYSRDPAVQHWPMLKKMASAEFFTTLSKSS